ncbi:MAG: hypothetical protein FK734_12650 [Asgard group archaeon]|nr:hypothetical protein [Asgard group archaeon]
MKTLTKIMIGLALITLIVLPATSQLTSAEAGNQINVQGGLDGITISTEYLTMKLVNGKPEFIWWNGNQSTADEMYKVQFVTLSEYKGSDNILDSKTELLNAIDYNLVSSIWNTDIVEEELAVHITMTLSGLKDGAELQFIVHVYATEQPLNGTEEVVKALSEVKFDIIIKNWVFSSEAKGIAINAQVLEAQNRHRVQIRNGTEEENGNYTRAMLFESEENGNSIVAYYKWTTFADIYSGGLKTGSINVGTAYLDDQLLGEGAGSENSGLVQQWLYYGYYGDSVTLVHDPSVGVNPESFSVPLFLYPVISGLVATVVVVVLVRRRKQA